MSQAASATASCLTRDALRKIVERAAFLQERLGPVFVATDRPGAREHAKLEEWKQAAALGDAELFRRRLEWDGVDLNQAGAILCGVKLAPEQDLPAWTNTLEQYVEAAAGADDSLSSGFLRPEEPFAFEDLFLPLVTVAANRVRNQAASALRLIREEAFSGLARALLRSLTSISGETLDLEFNVFRSSRQMNEGVFGSWPGAPGHEMYRQFVESMRSGELVSFLSEYPVLARFLATITDLWVASTIEFLTRLEQDFEAIVERFSNGTPVGSVVELQTGLSDRHNGGRATIRVRFENDLTLFYKPRDLRSEEHFYELLEWMNNHGIPLTFRVFRVLNRTTHGWSEKIAHLACDQQDQVNRYFLRAGMLLCLMYALEATDCHHENIIANGEYPALIDMESLLQHRVRMDGDGEQEGACSLANRMFFWDSVFRTALLPRWEFGITGESYDVSGLGGVDSHPTSMWVSSWEHTNTDAMKLRRQKMQTAPQQNIVRFADKTMIPSDYAEYIVSGFEQMYDFLREHSEEMFAPSGPFAAMRDMAVRFIYRHTRIYGVLLKSLFLPQHLRDGCDAGIRLEALARPLLHSEMSGSFWGILRAEHTALMAGDIPFFNAYANSSALPVSPDLSIPDFFNMPSFDLLRERFDRLTEADRQRQASYIRSAFYSRALSTTASHTAVPVEDPDADRQSEFVAEALKIGREIRDAAILSADGTASWITMAYFAEANRWQLQPMTPRLYDGTGGVALFLAALDHVTGRDEFHELALAALKSITAGFTHPVYDRVLFEPGIGAGLGASSVMYSFVRSSDLLHDPALMDSARVVFNMMTPERINTDTRLDLMSGAAGAILVLLAYYRITGEREALVKAEACGARLLEARTPGCSGYRAWPTLEGKLITGFSHGTAGIAYALTRLFQATGHQPYLEAAREGCAYEAGMYDPENGNWPDLRYEPVQGRATFQCSWCHGAPGIALGRIAGLELLDSPDLRLDMDRALQTTIQYSIVDTDHLCCGNLGRTDVLLEAARVLGITHYRDEALRLAASVLRRARGEGYGLGWKHGPYVPSFHQGMAGIGYQFLRLAYPERLPSILKWD